MNYRQHREWVDSVICLILRNDGPDGHIDGHDVITDFICDLLAGDGDPWLLDYKAKIVTTARRFNIP